MISKELFKKPNNRLEGEKEPPVHAKPEQPAFICPECKTALEKAELPETDYVCPRCGALIQVSARERALWLADADTFTERDADLQPVDRLGFPAYAGKLEKTRRETGEPEGVVTGTAEIGGQPCAIFCMDPFFIMGSMGAVVGEKITRIFEYATEKCLPVVGYTVSGGARIQEGMFSLMQMAKTSAACARHAQAGLPYITVLTHPTTAGVMASYATLGDAIVAEPGALIGFAGPRVIKETTQQDLPEGFQRSEFLLKHGLLDVVVHRKDLKKTLALLLDYMMPMETARDQRSEVRAQ